MKNFYKHLIELFFIFNEKIDNEENDSFEEDKILLFLLTFGVLQLYWWIYNLSTSINKDLLRHKNKKNHPHLLPKSPNQHHHLHPPLRLHNLLLSNPNLQQYQKVLRF